MKFFDKLSGKQDEFQALHDRQRTLGALKRMHAVHLALADMEPKPTPQDIAIASNVNIVDLRSRHPEYQPRQPLSIDDVDPTAYLNRPVLMPSYVKIMPVEEHPQTQTEIS